MLISYKRLRGYLTDDDSIRRMGDVLLLGVSSLSFFQCFYTVD